MTTTTSAAAKPRIITSINDSYAVRKAANDIIVNRMRGASADCQHQDHRGFLQDYADAIDNCSFTKAGAVIRNNDRLVPFMYTCKQALCQICRGHGRHRRTQLLNTAMQHRPAGVFYLTLNLSVKWEDWDKVLPAIKDAKSRVLDSALLKGKSAQRATIFELTVDHGFMHPHFHIIWWAHDHNYFLDPLFSTRLKCRWFDAVDSACQAANIYGGCIKWSSHVKQLKNLETTSLSLARYNTKGIITKKQDSSTLLPEALTGTQLATVALGLHNQRMSFLPQSILPMGVELPETKSIRMTEMRDEVDRLWRKHQTWFKGCPPPQTNDDYYSLYVEFAYPLRQRILKAVA